MSRPTSIKPITLNTNGTISYHPDANDGFDVYEITGSGAMTSSATIDITGVQSLPLTKRIIYAATMALNGNTITIGSTALTQQQASGGSTQVFCVKKQGGSWEYYIVDSSTISPKKVDGTKTTTLSGAGASTVVLNTATDYQTQILNGSGALTGTYTYTGTGNQNGDFFRVIYNGSFAATGGDITIFGIQLTDQQVQNGGVVIEATYNGSTWVTSMYMSPNTQFIGFNFYIPLFIDFGTMANSIYVSMPMEDNVEFISAELTVLSQPTTDDATVTFGNSGFAFTGGTDTIAAGTPVGTHGGVTVASGDGYINASQYLSVTWNKPTPDGQAFYFIRMRMR